MDWALILCKNWWENKERALVIRCPAILSIFYFSLCACIQKCLKESQDICEWQNYRNALFERTCIWQLRNKSIINFEPFTTLDNRRYSCKLNLYFWYVAIPVVGTLPFLEEAGVNTGSFFLFNVCRLRRPRHWFTDDTKTLEAAVLIILSGWESLLQKSGYSLERQWNPLNVFQPHSPSSHFYRYENMGLL